MKKVRCAIYTRKSSEEGLEQDFNSLHAQREACAAYIMSQASEGWSLLANQYDDGGISGGTLERPGLKRLLGDIAEGKIDIVVVYKVDRLTRSLMDFSTLVQAFDAADTSFVSVTQSFNTTTSIGRLTLNMLLSFAQFEREVTAERIRDKIAASKAKGMWMGGVPPIGYKPAGRTLEIVDREAQIIRAIFARYLEVDSVFDLQKGLAADGIYTPARKTLTGRQFGGVPFSRGQLFPILKNRIYRGEIDHKGKVYPGQHAAIVDRDLWNRVQEKLAGRVKGRRPKKQSAHPSLLAGLVFDAGGQPMVATHACKGARRYRYYVSRGLQHRHEEIEGSGMRIPAREIEGAVIERLAAAFDEPLTLAANVGLPFDGIDLGSMAAGASDVAARVRLRDAELLRRFVVGVHVDAGDARIQLSTAAMANVLTTGVAVSDRPFELQLGAKLARSGRAMRLIQTDGRRAAGRMVDESLLKLITKARGWWAQVSTGEFHVAALAREVGVSRAYMSNAIRLALLSPRLVEMIVAGQQPARLTAQRLIQCQLPIAWAEQEAVFG